MWPLTRYRSLTVTNATFTVVVVRLDRTVIKLTICNKYNYCNNGRKI